MGLFILTGCVVLVIFLYKRPKSPRASGYFREEKQISMKGKTEKAKTVDWGIIFLIILLVAFGIFCFKYVFT